MVRWEAGPFIQDDWRARPNLTVSLGLRYESQTLFSDHRDVAPRIGLAWAPGSAKNGRQKTVVRAGFGIFYDRINFVPFERAFSAHGWTGGWRNGIYPFVHFHSTAHEVLGIARGHARVEFGGAKGQVLAVEAGDVVVLPAGTGHRRVSSSSDLLVVGAYPRGSRVDQNRPGEIDLVLAPAERRAHLERAGERIEE